MVIVFQICCPDTHSHTRPSAYLKRLVKILAPATATQDPA